MLLLQRGPSSIPHTHVLFLTLLVTPAPKESNIFVWLPWEPTVLACSCPSQVTNHHSAPQMSKWTSVFLHRTNSCSVVCLAVNSFSILPNCQSQKLLSNLSHQSITKFRAPFCPDRFKIWQLHSISTITNSSLCLTSRASGLETEPASNLESHP